MGEDDGGAEEEIRPDVRVGPGQAGQGDERVQGIIEGADRRGRRGGQRDCGGNTAKCDEGETS